MTANVVVRDTDVVPRRPPTPQAGPDEWAAWRVGRERERKGWSLGELARRVTEAGAPMQHQAIWQIENRTPPRRISLSEAIAFCKVFGLADVAELGEPPEELAHNLATQMGKSFNDWVASLENLAEQIRDLRGSLPGINPDVPPGMLKALEDWAARIDEEITRVRSWLADELHILVDTLAASADGHGVD